MIAKTSRWILSLIDRHPLLSGFTIAMVLRLIMFTPFETSPTAYQDSGDSSRFVHQAIDLIEQQAFLINGERCTHLPPGYPFFLALCFSLWKSLTLPVIIQVVVSALGSSMMFLMLRSKGKAIATLGLLLMALHPWSAWRSWHIMSESIAASLMLLLLYGIYRIESERASLFSCFVLGASASAIMLTCPGTLFVAGFSVLVALFKTYRRPKLLLSVMAGAGIFMAPWQLHCYNTLGQVLPTLMTSGPPGSNNGTLKLNRGFQQWVRTWLVYPGEFLDVWMYFVWDSHPRVNEGTDLISDRAFDSQIQKISLETQVSEWRNKKVPIRERDQYFAELAHPLIDKDPVKFHLILPLLRGLNQWLEMPFVWHFQKQYVARISTNNLSNDIKTVGRKGALQRFLKTVGSILTLATHYVYILILTITVYTVTRPKNPFAIAIVAGTILFTVLGAYSGTAELRRNIPFFPALFFLVFYLPPRSIRRLAETFQRIQRMGEIARIKTVKNSACVFRRLSDT